MGDDLPDWRESADPLVVGMEQGVELRSVRGLGDNRVPSRSPWQIVMFDQRTCLCPVTSPVTIQSQLRRVFAGASTSRYNWMISQLGYTTGQAVNMGFLNAEC